jgi:hypothetical protein
VRPGDSAAVGHDVVHRLPQRDGAADRAEPVTGLLHRAGQGLPGAVPVGPLRERDVEGDAQVDEVVALVVAE